MQTAACALCLRVLPNCCFHHRRTRNSRASACLRMRHRVRSVGGVQWAVGSNSKKPSHLSFNPKAKGELLMKLKNYQELIAWQKSMDLVKEVYKSSREFPREEVYGLASQVRRASVSIPSNIAEGQGRKTTADFLRHLSIAYGSLREVETQIMIARRLKYIVKGKVESVLSRAGEVGRLLNGLMASLDR